MSAESVPSGGGESQGNGRSRFRVSSASAEKRQEAVELGGGQELDLK